MTPFAEIAAQPPSPAWGVLASLTGAVVGGFIAAFVGLWAEKKKERRRALYSLEVAVQPMLLEVERKTTLVEDFRKHLDPIVASATAFRPLVSLKRLQEFDRVLNEYRGLTESDLQRRARPHIDARGVETYPVDESYRDKIRRPLTRMVEIARKE
jgi:hypothetical protein